MALSLIIPAHNEATGIEGTLQALADGHAAVDRIVVCNGCQDHTADIARRVGARVIETDVASKSHALNLGDSVAGPGPRFYVDADVLLTGQAVAEVAIVLATQPGILVAAPLIQFNFADRPWSVRAFYEVWQELPYCREGMIGSGVYAVSEEGRKRWGKFPDITADDAFVRLHFKPEERLTVTTCTFTVAPPRTLSGVIKIKTRAFFGDYELKARFPELFTNKQDHHGSALWKLARQPKWWSRVMVYLYVRGVSRLMGYRRFYLGNHKHWERDESSRQPAVERA